MSKTLPKSAIVTGAGGFLGSELCALLEFHGYLVTRVVGPTGPSGLRLYPADLSKTGAWMDLFDADAVVFHLAGHASVPDSVADPLASKAHNLDTTVHVLEAARLVGAPVVLASTGAVYADSPDRWNELAPTSPRSPYAAAKLASEEFAHSYAATYGMRIWIARLFSVYGPGMHGMAVRDFVQRICANPKRLTIRGDGKQIRDYVHVRDAASALIAISGTALGGTYNVASGDETTVTELASAVANACGFPNCRIEPDGVFPRGEPQAMRADVSRLREIGFRPTITFKQGLAETVGWLQKRLEESTGDET